MSNQDVKITIRSNTDSLSEAAVYDALVKMVGHSAEEGADFLKLVVPKGETLGLSTHAGHHGPIDDGINVKAEVGIPPILAGGATDPNSMRYPMYVDKGTGIFGDTHEPIMAKREAMKLPPDGVHSMFHKVVKGQEGQFFMEKTFEFMKESMKVNAEFFKAELKSKLTAGELK